MWPKTYTQSSKMLSSSRDSWEKLVAAVLRREHDWQLAHELSRSPSIISTLSSSSSPYSNRKNSSVSQDVSASPPLPVPPTMVPSSSQVGNHKSGATRRGGIVAGATNMFAAPRSIRARFYRRRKTRQHMDLEGVIEVYGLRRFTLWELVVASDNFNNGNIVGRGAFSYIYKGHLADGSLVAIKRLLPGTGKKNCFETEAMIYSVVENQNILRPFGFCIAQAQQLLVYPFMVNGSVASWLIGRPDSQPPLDWPTRMRIAMGTARGLAYMHDHCDPKIIHHNIKAANIFLDEDFEAVVGGFELAKLLHHNIVDDAETVLRYTPGYIDPEYISTRRYSDKSDVFAFGIFLLELITAQRAFNLARLANVNYMKRDWVRGLVKKKKWEELVDDDLQGNYRLEELEQLQLIALRCTLGSPNERPNMSEIVRMLETRDRKSRTQQ